MSGDNINRRSMLAAACGALAGVFGGVLGGVGRVFGGSKKASPFPGRTPIGGMFTCFPARNISHWDRGQDLQAVAEATTKLIYLLAVRLHESCSNKDYVEWLNGDGKDGKDAISRLQSVTASGCGLDVWQLRKMAEHFPQYPDWHFYGVSRLWELTRDQIGKKIHEKLGIGDGAKWHISSDQYTNYLERIADGESVAEANAASNRNA